MNENLSFKLTGTIKKVLFYNSETNFSISVLENGQKICGTYLNTDINNLINEDIILTGNWISHKKYGIQFSFDTLEVKNNEFIFFLTKIIKGISTKVASELCKKFDDEELTNILDKKPTDLLKFKGIKEKKLKLILDSWNKFKHLKEFGSFLSKYGFTSSLINKIYTKFNEVDDLIKIIKNNPYIITQIKGIGFKKADEVAKLLKIDEKSDIRIIACLDYIIKINFDNNGNSSINKESLFKLLDNFLGFNNQNMLYDNCINQMLLNKRLYQTSKNRYSISTLYFSEKNILEFFKIRKNRVLNNQITSNFEKYIEEKQLELGFNLSNEQIEAVKLINDGYNSMFLIGYAGTGKSTCCRAILDLLRTIISYDDIVCIALSGIASQRISDTTKYNSKTIQSLLIKHKDEDFFPYKVILLDEASMVNSVTFNQIISKIKLDSIFIVVGDDGQLPAIGAGDILSNSIKHKLASICKLTKIYRQNENKAITLIANDIREGKVPEYNKEYEDFKFINVSIENYYKSKNILKKIDFYETKIENTKLILDNILDISSNYIKKLYELINKKDIAKSLTLFQVITPIKSGILGVENLNIQLQKLFNNNTNNSKITNLYEYKIMDKVIHIKNENMKSQTLQMYRNNSTNYIEKRVFNGQLGLIIKLDFANENSIVLYPNDDMVVFYDFDNLNKLLSLAYCLTIHKTQGMEYDNALIPMTFSHYIMHNTKLLYTAITRAKNMCYIVGEEEAFKSACKKIEMTKRETVIDDLMNISL